MGTIQVRNWKTFQHYTGRKPPWIKLHRQLLENREWFNLSGDACKLLAECWLLASEHDGGAIPLTTADLCWRLRRPDVLGTAALLQELAAAGFIDLCEHDASAPQAPRKRAAMLETEAEKETEEQNSAANAAAAEPPEDEPQQEADTPDSEAVDEAWRKAIGALRSTWPKGKLPRENVDDRPWSVDREYSIFAQLIEHHPADVVAEAVALACKRAIGVHKAFSLRILTADTPKAQAWYHELIGEAEAALMERSPDRLSFTFAARTAA